MTVNLLKVRTLVLSAVLLSLPVAVHGAGEAQQWKRLRTKHGLTLMSRSVEGERFPELRIRTTTALPAGRVVAYLMGRYIDDADPGFQRRMVERSPQAARWTDLIRTPLISDRCATSTSRVSKDGSAGGIEVAFASGDDWPLGKPTAACVPLRSRGSWTVRPTAGGSELTYTIFADPGGGIPVFLVRGAMEDDALDRVRRVIGEAAK